MFYHRGFSHDVEALHFKIVTLCALFALSTFGPCTITGTHNPMNYDLNSSENRNQIPPQTSLPKLNLENICKRSDLFCFPSTLSSLFTDFHTTESNLSGLSKVKPHNTLLEKSTPPMNNLTWSTNHGSKNIVSCSLDYQENPQIDENDTKQESFRIKSSLVNDFSSPNVQISHHTLDFGQKHLHFPSLSYLTIKNTQNHTPLNIYKPYSTNLQFYPCNNTEFTLPPGETASICFIFFPKSLGLSSGHLILQTSLGGFLIGARGFAVESEFGGRSRLLASFDVLMPCDGNWTMSVALLVENDGPEIVTVLKIREIGENLESFLRTKFVEGLILFPYSVTQVGIVTYTVNRDGDLHCKLLVETNKSVGPTLEILCDDFAGLCSRSQNDGLLDYENVDHVLPTLGIKVTETTKSDESILGNWRSQGTDSKMSVLNNKNKELTFPIVHINTHQSKYIKVINPSNQPVIMQLLLNSGEIITNCQTSNQILHPSSFLNSQITPSSYGFSIPAHAVTQAYVHPHKKAVLGPVFFHPSGRCEWKSSALVRNNLSGVEWVSIRGSGGLPGLVLLNGSDPVNSVKLEHYGFGQRAVEVLLAKNTGDLPVEVKKVSVSGTKCELDGFFVGSCNGFGLLPGESRKVTISFRADLCAEYIRREVEFVMSGGILVVPVEVGIKTPMMLATCKRSLVLTKFKKFVVAVVVISGFLILMVSSCTVSFVIRDGNLSEMSSKDVCPKVKIQPSETTKEVAVVENLTVKTGKDKARRRKKKRVSGSGLMGQFEVSSSHSSNSTPSSPLSPPSSFTPKKSQEFSPSQFVRVKCETVPPVKEVEPSAPVRSPSPQARAPGAERKAVKPESLVSDPKYKYNIWDDHLRGLPAIPEDNNFGSLFAMSPHELFTNVTAKQYD